MKVQWASQAQSGSGRKPKPQGLNRRTNKSVENQTRTEAKTSVRTFISHPVGRAVQVAACKATAVGAIPTRHSIFSGIGVERHASVFQTEIERALLSCPSTFPSESGPPAG